MTWERNFDMLAWRTSGHGVHLPAGWERVVVAEGIVEPDVGLAYMGTFNIVGPPESTVQFEMTAFPDGLPLKLGIWSNGLDPTGMVFAIRGTYGARRPGLASRIMLTACSDSSATLLAWTLHLAGDTGFSVRDLWRPPTLETWEAARRAGARRLDSIRKL